jgi:hypothetical protein
VIDIGISAAMMGGKFNAKFFTPEHIESVFQLPEDNELRKLFILAGVDSYITYGTEDEYMANISKFEGVELELARHSTNVLRKAEAEIYGRDKKGHTTYTGGVTYEDPFQERRFNLLGAGGEI